VIIGGTPRTEVVEAILATRGVRLPAGDPDDHPAVTTVNGLVNRAPLMTPSRMV
jgi:hypothetical protein